MAKARTKKAAQMHSLVRNTNALFTALQRVDSKVNDYVVAKTTELNDFADAFEAWQDIKQYDEPAAGGEGSVN